jgi:hypothetical protein
MAACVATAAAQDMRNPRIIRATVQWSEVTAQLETPAEHAAATVVERLNQATSKLFANIAASPVPVLLPFNAAQLLRDDAADAAKAPTDYLTDVGPPPFFQAGPSGYDAVFSFRAREIPSFGIHYSERINVHISGSLLLYEVDEPAGIISWPVNGGLGTDFPGIKRFYLDSSVRYTFVRFGVPYAVSIECHDGQARFRKISCREADKVATRILKALQVAGGTPQPQSGPVEINIIDRPQAVSPVFTYHSPGDLLPGSGMKRQSSGSADYTVYSKMRFPLADAPAFANSQSFMNWGDCDQTGRVSMGWQGKTAAYRCRVNDLPLIADESANYAYPWRDNFCEHRFFFVGTCPGGLGHQGQDIRPSSCKQRIEGANRCEPYQHDVVAARDGIVLRAPGQIALQIITNTATERVRFRYLHMYPKHLDHDGVLSGRAVREGEVIGKVGNYFRRERATTYHLHFDMQVPTKYGWVFVNPYMSLVAAYERQIMSRGRELSPDGTPIAIGTAALPMPPAAPVPLPVPDPISVPVSPPMTVPAAVPAPPPVPLPEPAPISVAAPPPVSAAAVVPDPIPAPAAVPTPAANPVQIEVQSNVASGIGSDTAAHERLRSKQR